LEASAGADSPTWWTQRTDELWEVRTLPSLHSLTALWHLKP
jgi:hypothetical protein